jgi:hypothetical protein
MLEIGLADDARAALRGSAGVRQRKLLETEHPTTAPRHFGDGRAAHRSKADDDDVPAHDPTIRRH